MSSDAASSECRRAPHHAHSYGGLVSPLGDPRGLRLGVRAFLIYRGAALRVQALSPVLLLGVSFRSRDISTAVFAPCCRFWRDSPVCRQLPQCVMNLGFSVGSWQWQTKFEVSVEDKCSVNTSSEDWLSS